MLKALVRRARRVLKAHRGATDWLISSRRAFDLSPRADRFFLRAMNEAFAHHFLACPQYRARCLQMGVAPGDIRTVEDLPRIPWFFVSVFKRHRLVSVPEERIALTLTSSGTGGERSAIYLDRKSLRRIRTIVHHIYHEMGMVSRRRTNYLCFTYDPRVARDLGTAFSDELLTHLTRVGEVVYAIRPAPLGDWYLDRQACLEALERFSRQRRPVRLLGFPAHLWEVLAEAPSYHFGPHSYVLTGGGWKGLGEREIPRELFRREVAARLGIPPANVRDLYGMVEHGVPYTECQEGRKHVPRYSRVYVRDPGTLELLGYGQKGIFQFLTPYLHSFPALSLLTTDIGSLEPHCPCGRRSPVVVLEGRGGITRHRGCAIAALDLLRPQEVTA
jgi:hypothetical protein